MGFVEIDPETGEGVLHPDPNMDWTGGQDGSTDPSNWLPHTEEPAPDNGTGLQDLLHGGGLPPGIEPLPGDGDGGNLPSFNPDDWNPSPTPTPGLEWTPGTPEPTFAEDNPDYID
jgi:hypothetical protein